MPVFDYTAYAQDGRREQGSIEAASQDELMSQLKRQGLLLASATQTNAAASRRRAWFQPQLSARQYAQLFGDLGRLTGAGITLTESVALTLERQKRSTPSQRLMIDVQKAIGNGADLSAALFDARHNVPGIVIAMVVAGEARGDMGSALQQAAAHLDRRASLEEKLRSTLIYPLILAALAVVAVTIILAFLVPNLLPLFEGTGAEPPVVLVYANALSQILATHGQMIAGLMALGLLGLLPLLRLEAMQRFGAGLVLKLPLLGAVFRQRNSALFARTLGTLLTSDVVMPTALAAAADVMPNRLLSQSARTLIDDINSGETLSKSIASKKQFGTTLTRFIAVGEASGQLGDMLLQYADMTDAQVEQSTERLMSLLAPALTIAIGLFVGGLILSVLQAIMSVNDIAI